MIRKVTVAVLSVAAFATLLLWCLGVRKRWSLEHLWNVTPDLGWENRAEWENYKRAWIRYKAGQVEVGYESKSEGGGAEELLRKEIPGVAWIWVHRIAAPARASSFVWHTWIVGVYLWVVLAGLASYPMMTFFRGPYRRYRRRAKGRCIRCGYHLTGNVSGICPECGERI